MNALCFFEHGGPEVLRHQEVPDPQPGPGEALVRVRACALNHLDIWVRRGWPAGRRVVVDPGLSTVEDELTRRGEP